MLKPEPERIEAFRNTVCSVYILIVSLSLSRGKKPSFLERQQKFDEIFHLISNLQVFFEVMVTKNLT